MQKYLKKGDFGIFQRGDNQKIVHCAVHPIGFETQPQQRWKEGGNFSGRTPTTLYNLPLQISKNSSTPYFRSQPTKERSVCRFTCEPEEAEITTPVTSNPRLFSASQSGATLGSSSSHPSGDMSRVASHDGAMQMFAIGENDFRVGK